MTPSITDLYNIKPCPFCGSKHVRVESYVITDGNRADVDIHCYKCQTDFALHAVLGPLVYANIQPFSYVDENLNPLDIWNSRVTEEEDNGTV